MFSSPLTNGFGLERSLAVPCGAPLSVRAWSLVWHFIFFNGICFYFLAISQRHHSSHFDFLEAEKAAIVQDIKDFYKQHICDHFPDKSGIQYIYLNYIECPLT